MTHDFAHAREMMVAQQVRPWDVPNLRVLDVIGRLPREAFVPDAQRGMAYADLELPINGVAPFAGPKMMKPVVEGRTLQALDLQPGDDVLEIGTGSGYLTACLGALARDVVSLEIRADLADAARDRLAAQRLDGNVRIEAADAFAWASNRQFDKVCVTAAVESIPARFLEWLRPGGKLFIVRGHSPSMEAVLVHGDVNGARIDSLFETDIEYLEGATPAPRFQF